MNDLGVIDQFTNVFSQYIDSGFGLVRGEVSFLSATLIAIDITLAGLFWVMGGEDDVIGRLVKKTIYVGAFAFIINNWHSLADILFRSFAGLGLTASGSSVAAADLLRPGRLAAIGVDAARPILHQIGELTGWPDIFGNADTILVLFLAWVIVVIAFFVLAVQLFVTLIEFKLTTLAGFVLVPFALWNQTSFLAERVLGHVVSAGIKVLVLAVIVGIGAGLFGQFQAPAGTALTIDNALAVMLASFALLGLGLFGPSIASGLVSGAPQLGAGAAAGTALAGGGLITAGAVASAGAARLAGGAVLGASTLVRGARAAYQEGVATAGGFGAAGVRAGVENVVRAGGAAMARRAQAAWDRATGATSSTAPEAVSSAQAPEPEWARRMRASQRISGGISTAAHTARSGDAGGAGASPELDPDE